MVTKIVSDANGHNRVTKIVTALEWIARGLAYSVIRRVSSLRALKKELPPHPQNDRLVESGPSTLRMARISGSIDAMQYSRPV